MARGDQPRWPGGTPVAPGGRGPGGGRWRGGADWAQQISARIRGGGGGMPPVGGRLIPVGQGIRLATVDPDAQQLYQAQEINTIGLIWERDGRFLALRPAVQHSSIERQLRDGEWFETQDQAHAYLWEYGQTERGRRERYNQAMLAEAASFEAENEGDYDDVDPEAEDFDPDEFGSDEHLVAQMEIVENARNRGDDAAWDSAVDHLRGMLLISYADDEDFPPNPDLID